MKRIFALLLAFLTITTQAQTAFTIPNVAITGGTIAGLSSPLPIASGGTASSTATGTGSVVLSTSPTLVTPILGTPSSGVATNLTGTAAGLTAGAVTTNANLTGPITSSGNATSVAAQTGTGSTFVMQTAPTLTGLTVSGGTFASRGVTDNATAANWTVANGLTSSQGNQGHAYVGVTNEFFVGSNELLSGNPFGFDTLVYGAATVAASSVRYQTQRFNSTADGYIAFQGGGGRFVIGTNTDDGVNVLQVTGNSKLSGAISAGTQYQVNGTLLSSTTAPTISSGFGASPSVASNNGTATFRVNIGTGGTATGGVVGLPTASNGWNCFVSELAPNATALLSVTVVTASTTSSVTVQNDLLSTGAATAWQASQVLIFHCAAY